MIIYYNPECSKCRETKELMEENNCQFEIREYLAQPPTKEELKELLKKLDIQPVALVRKSEPLFIEKFADKTFNDEEWITVLSENPVLIERPIIIDGEKAVIGRPPVLVLELLKK